jgi:hypothetical protein
MARNADNRKAPLFFWKRFKVCLYKDLNGITAGVNVDANGRIAKIDFVTSSVLSSNDRMGHVRIAPPNPVVFHSRRDVQMTRPIM